MTERTGNGPLERFFDWVAKSAGSIADWVGNGIADARDKLVFESFFQRHVPERRAGNDLGWFQDHPDVSDRTGMTALEQLYGSLSPVGRDKHFCEPGDRSSEPGWFARHFSPDSERAAERDQPEHSRTEEHGIER